ncbi:helicase HerA-like domain-containing protein [Streptomyces sp. NRRL F-4428]|uniref:helicase HerA-like domain-containing protein n=1 Tax=Streptomyces sp. NRRL F-4428 TaxID=1609137 RepID=UPI00061FD868|nr:helicase HerA-like domain-containing protein [Streptomyces sp. NRRL F-4428]KJK54495.1 ATPase [Streptomyces sp. NRRL F-4428]
MSESTDDTAAEAARTDPADKPDRATKVDATDPADPADPAARIAAGYAFTGPALDLGALLWDGTCLPDRQIRIPLSMLNRHGLVAGATGTGKTKTLQLIAEQLSANGVPVFLADVKGDVSGITAPGTPGERVGERARQVAQNWEPTGFPGEFYSLGGIGPGIPVRSTVTAFGPVLMSKVLQLNQTQEQSLGLIFHYADTKGLELVDLKDLRAVVAFLVSDQGKAELKGIGGLSTVTAGVILRALTAFETQGATEFFGEPEFDTGALLRTAADGRGVVSVLELPAVQDKPQLFSTFLMWLLADLYNDLPEVGDLDRPKLVFFFDEAHLLFDGASKAFLQSVTQTVRLIRSKGVGVFFVTQTPKDVPADVLGQLGNRVQHALRAFTPDDAKALKATVKTFPHSAYDLEELLTGLGTGEAVVTVLSENGAPTPVAATRLRAPQSLMGPIGAAGLERAVQASPLWPRYAQPVDRESAYEKISAEQAAAEARAEAAATAAEAEKEAEAARKHAEAAQKEHARAAGRGAPREEPSLAEQVVGSGLFRSLARSVGTQLGREISRSVFGTARRRR